MTQKHRDEARKFDAEYIEHIIFAHLGVSGSASTHLAQELFNQFNERLQTARIKALMEAEKVAHKWPLSVDNCVLAIKIEQKTGDAASAYAFVADQIAQAIKKLHEE